jgi:hypothetical protein
MNQFGHSLRRLLRAAARAPKESPVALPPFLEARLLAQWRSTAPEDESALLAVFFRRAVVCAGLTMMLSIGWNWLGDRGEVAGAPPLADFEIALQTMP